ncbi:carotenoid biosynthesis protein, partial [candidate division KSB1 bacterium]|nr:carotenoid biosynthesis protein [candidate division KSB1 bacterium]
MHNRHIKIALLYFILLAGGIWHLLGWFQHLMAVSAGPLLIVLNLWLIAEGLVVQPTENRRAFLLWSAFVALAGFAAEWLGMTSGKIFGIYHYSPILQPQIAGVPLAIGFAWIGIALASTAVTQTIGYKPTKIAQSLVALQAALLMVAFDLLMEPAAVHLGYWSWQGDFVPLQNYIAWGVLGWGFLLIAPRSLYENKTPRLWLHAY